MSTVLRERRGRIEVVTLNRPEVRNALDPETIGALSETFREIADDIDIWAAILTGAGNLSFCAGMDLKAFVARGGGRSHRSPNIPSFTRTLCPKPVIGAANGAAVAGGLELLLACDLIVAAEHAVFAIPEVKRGLIAAGGGLVRLPRRLPLAIALEMGLTGDSIDARRAQEVGLVNRVVPGANVVDEAVALAERICLNSPAAVRGSKKVIYAAIDGSEKEAWEECSLVADEIFGSADAIEGARAYLEKRAPSWSAV
jgi:enoyl-CoA hydratase